MAACPTDIGVMGARLIGLDQQIAEIERAIAALPIISPATSKRAKAVAKQRAALQAKHEMLVRQVQWATVGATKPGELPTVVPASTARPTSESPQAKTERHRARKISDARWLKEVRAALGRRMLDLSADEQRSMVRELADPGTELQRMMWAAADNSKGQRVPAWDIASRIYQTMIARRFATEAPAQQAARPEWSMW
jgi:hypothetical protein